MADKTAFRTATEEAATGPPVQRFGVQVTMMIEDYQSGTTVTMQASGIGEGLQEGIRAAMGKIEKTVTAAIAEPAVVVGKP